jgi:hypothetical protein
MLSLPKQLARAAKGNNPSEASKMLRQAQHDRFVFFKQVFSC